MKKISLILLSAVALYAAEIEWNYSYEDARVVAQKEKKPMLLFMNKAGCESCEFMHKVLAEEVVKMYVEKHYVPVSLTPASKDIPRELIPRSTPVFHFVTSEGVKVQESLLGGKQASGFIRTLRKGVRAFKKQTKG